MFNYETFCWGFPYRAFPERVGESKEDGKPCVSRLIFSLRTADAFPVVGGREATTGNASAVRRLLDIQRIPFLACLRGVQTF